MRYYNNDPREMSARFSSNCAKCGKRMSKGDTILYFPASQKAFCGAPCGREDYNNFQSSAADEAVYNGTGNPLYG